MKFFRKFDTYLLEHHPILWHSKFVYLLLTGMVLWLLFFISGYLVVDLDMMKHHRLSEVYFDTYAVLVHSILVIVVLSVWALFFFRKSAIRHYYPLKPLYFTRLFVYLIAGFFPLISLMVPYDSGAKLKTRTLLNPAEMQQDARVLNLALAFLPVGEEHYQFDDRIYPQPFPLKHARIGVEGWVYDHSLKIKDSVGNLADYFPQFNDPVPNTVIDSTAYQFFKTKSVEISTECGYSHSYELITSFEHPDSSLDLHKISVLNYSSVEFPGSYLPAEQYRPDDNYQYARDIEFLHYAPTIHRWVHNDEQDSIVSAIQAFKKVLDRYGIDYLIDEKLIVQHLSFNHYANFTTHIVDNEINQYNKPIYLSILDTLDKRIRLDRWQSAMGYDNYELNMLYKNCDRAWFNPEPSAETWFGFL